jgi:hypothetical protein
VRWNLSVVLMAFPLFPGMVSVFSCVFGHLDFFLRKSSV